MYLSVISSITYLYTVVIVICDSTCLIHIHALCAWAVLFIAVQNIPFSVTCTHVCLCMVQLYFVLWSSVSVSFHTCLRCVCVFVCMYLYSGHSTCSIHGSVLYMYMCVWLGTSLQWVSGTRMTILVCACTLHFFIKSLFHLSLPPSLSLVDWWLSTGILSC